MIKRRVEVQRCPAVPTEPNNTAVIAIFKSAFSERIMALLPPNSNNERPKRSPTIFPTRLPTRVLPVAEINGTRLSAKKLSPTYLEPPATRFNTPSGTSFSFNTSAMIL